MFSHIASASVVHSYSQMDFNRPSSPRYWLLGIVLMSMSFAGCLNNGTDCVPSGNCTSIAPTTADLRLKLTINSENASVPIAVYEGDASDSLLYFRDTIAATTISYTVAVDQRYSAVAKYRRGNVTILAVDGDKTKLTSNNDCGDRCYQVTDAQLNLRLAE
jgi:hypothetical protein